MYSEENGSQNRKQTQLPTEGQEKAKKQY